MLWVWIIVAFVMLTVGVCLIMAIQELLGQENALKPRKLPREIQERLEDDQRRKMAQQVAENHANRSKALRFDELVGGSIDDVNNWIYQMGLYAGPATIGEWLASQELYQMGVKDRNGS